MATDLGILYGRLNTMNIHELVEYAEYNNVNLSPIVELIVDSIIDKTLVPIADGNRRIYINDGRKLHGPYAINAGGSIINIKTYLSPSFGLTPSTMRLMYNGSVLADDQVIGSISGKRNFIFDIGANPASPSVEKQFPITVTIKKAGVSQTIDVNVSKSVNIRQIKEALSLPLITQVIQGGRLRSNDETMSNIGANENSKIGFIFNVN